MFSQTCFQILNIVFNQKLYWSLKVSDVFCTKYYKIYNLTLIELPSNNWFWVLTIFLIYRLNFSFLKYKTFNLWYIRDLLLFINLYYLFCNLGTNLLIIKFPIKKTYFGERTLLFMGQIDISIFEPCIQILPQGKVN